jgi:hypothetical protein
LNALSNALVVEGWDACVEDTCASDVEAGIRVEKAAIADSQLGPDAEGVVEPDTREVGLAALDCPNRAVGSVPKADTDRVGIPVRARGGRPRPELRVADELDDLTLPVEGAVHVRASRWEREGGLERRVCRLRNRIRQSQLVKERWVCAS